MQPSFELRIDTMIKAMREVVMPAIDPGSSAALEQAALVTASLDLICEQIDFAHWYEVSDIKLNSQMLVDLAGLLNPDEAKALDNSARSALELARRHDVTLSQLRNVSCELRNSSCSLIEDITALGDGEMIGQANEIVLTASDIQNNRERAFVAKTGFDSTPDTLKSIDKSLN
jgi:hypothetical protein